MSDTLLTLVGSVELQAAAGKKPSRLAIMAYSGGVMRVDGFGDVAIELSGLTLPTSLPILDGHANNLDAVIANGQPAIERGVLVARGDLVDGPVTDRVVQLLRGGVELQASVGVQPAQRRFVRPGDKVTVNQKEIVAASSGLTVIERGDLREISVLPIGADGTTSVALAARKGNPMPDIVTAPAITPAIDTEAIRREERDRLAQIEAACKGFDHLNITELRAKAVSAEISVDSLKSGILERLRASRSTSGPIGYGTVTGTLAANHLAASLMVKAGYSKAAETAFGPDVLEQSRRLHGQSLPDLCRAALQIDGRDIPHSREGMIRASVSTGSMAVALGTSANKILESVYQTAPASWKMFSTIRPASNFKTQSSVRPSFAGTLEALAPGGEIRHGTFAEETFDWHVSTYAKMFSIDRTQIVNDDLSAFSEIVPALGRAAARGVSDLVFSTLLSGAAAFWTAGRNNYDDGATDSVLTAAGLANAIGLLRKMVDNEGNLLDFAPSVLLVPPELEQAGRELLSSGTVQRYVASGTDRQPMGNPWQGLAELAVEPRLSNTSYTGYSLTAWWLFSAPENASVLVGFLDGLQTPTIETFDFNSEPNKLSMTYRCYFDFGCALGDYRSSVMLKGAA